MTEELEQLLKNLKLRRMLEIYDEQLRAADKADISYSDFMTRLVRAQWQAKQEGALEWRIQRATLPERLTLETFPYAHQPGVNRKQIRGFAELEFIAKAENIGARFRQRQKGRLRPPDIPRGRAGIEGVKILWPPRPHRARQLLGRGGRRLILFRCFHVRASHISIIPSRADPFWKITPP